MLVTRDGITANAGRFASGVQLLTLTVSREKGNFGAQSALEGVGNDVPLFLVCGLDVL